MGKFLRENWVWIAGPIVVLLVAIVLFYWLADDPGVKPMVYQNY